MLLDRIQDHLEAVYGVRCELRASDFHVGHPDLARALGATGRAREELLIRQSDSENVDVALFVSHDVFHALQAFDDSPAEAAQHDLGAYCEVAEGVSHFMYFTRAAQADRTVSLLEMEAQGEIDKFVSCALHRWTEGVAAMESLSTRLFDRVRYVETLNEPERWRYVEANRLAKAYARKLTRHFRARRLDDLFGELRRMYRMGAEAKLAYLATTL